MKNRIITVLLSILILIFVLSCFVLTGCQDDPVNNPSEEYVISCLQKVPGIVKIAAATEFNDPNGNLNKPGGYTAHVFFAYELIDLDEEVHGYDLISQGTDAGGSIEVYANKEDANKRNEYLAMWDGTVVASGSHTVLGTCVIRTSDELTASQQKFLESNIVAALLGNDDEIQGGLGGGNSGSQNGNISDTKTKEKAVKDAENYALTADELYPSYLSWYLSTLTKIGSFAFASCSRLESITVPDTVTSIGDGAFSASHSLTSVTLSDNVKSIGRQAFWDCKSLTNINIPHNVTIIESLTFTSCESLTSITIPNSVKSIGSSAFSNCTNLTNVIFEEGSQLTSIGQTAFYYCSSLTNVYYSGTEEEWNNISIGSNNSPLTNSNILFNYTGEESGDMPIPAATVSYMGASTIEDICVELFEELEVVKSDNVFGNITLTTTKTGYIYWITPLPITSIKMVGVLFTFSDFGTYEYNGTTYYCYTTDTKFEIGTYKFIITHTCLSVCVTCGGCMDVDCWADACLAKCDCSENNGETLSVVSYVGSSMIEEVCDELFTELQVVNTNNLYGRITFTTTAGGYLYWITPMPIASIEWTGIFTYSDFGAYEYNGVTYYCYTTDADFKAGTYEFIIPYICNSVCETCGGCLDLKCKAEVCSNKCDCE